MKKKEISIIVRPENRARHRLPANGIEGSPDNNLNIKASSIDRAFTIVHRRPHGPNHNPHSLPTSDMKHRRPLRALFRMIPAIREEKPNTLTRSPLVGFTGHKLWMLGSINLLLTLLRYDGKERVTRIIKFSIIKNKLEDDMILGQPALFRLQAISSTTHGTVKFRTTSGLTIVTALNTWEKPLRAIAAWATVHIPRKQHTTTITTHTVKFKKNTHTQDRRKGRQPQTNSSGGEGRDINNVTTPEKSRIVSTNTQRSWISLIISTCLRATGEQNMEKEETRKQTREVMGLDRKHNQGIATVRATWVGNCPKKEDEDKRLTTTVRVRN
uniref:Uncharacterized protein n=1 Tax=Lactuca sativa TaxID=4236 RepID=A0A9R1W034_LACSA|nr:hypothetical protein LSAT_V11C400217600 [Lactuca sativa]